jgi:hypothetical protein
MMMNVSPCRSSGMNGSGGAIWKPGKVPELFRCVDDELAIEAQHVVGVTELEEDRTAVDRVDRMQAELERRHDAEVAPAASELPEQVGVLVLARDEEPSVRGHDVGRDEVVTRETHATREVADATAQREAANAGRRDDAARRREAEGTRRGVVVAPGGAAFRTRPAVRRIDANATHPRQVDHDATVVRPETRDAVAAAANGKVYGVLAREVDRGDHVAVNRGTGRQAGTRRNTGPERDRTYSSPSASSPNEARFETTGPSSRCPTARPFRRTNASSRP